MFLVFFLSLCLNGFQFQKDFDRCEAVNFKESGCAIHKRNLERYGKK